MLELILSMTAIVGMIVGVFIGYVIGRDESDRRHERYEDLLNRRDQYILEDISENLKRIVMSRMDEFDLSR